MYFSFFLYSSSSSVIVIACFVIALSYVVAFFCFSLIFYLSLSASLSDILILLLNPLHFLLVNAESSSLRSTFFLVSFLSPMILFFLPSKDPLPWHPTLFSQVLYYILDVFLQINMLQSLSILLFSSLVKL